MKTLCYSLLLCLATIASAEAASVKVASLIPYSEEDTVQGNIKKECDIGQSIHDGLAAEMPGGIEKVASVNSAGEGRNLLIEVTDAQSSGNAFIGHRKSVAAKGKLYEGGKLIGSFRVSRVSGGGAFGNYKGSCAVIHGCGRAVGKDIARWLAAPVDGARLGDLK